MSWWNARFGGVTRREAWGYGVWFFFGAIVAVPELWAAIDPRSARWPTISATVGELEYWYPVVALGVVAVIVAAAYSAIRLPPERTGVLPREGAAPAEDEEVPGRLPMRTGAGGRLTASRAALPEIGAGLYFAFALVVISAATALAVATTDVDDEHTVGRTLYGLTALFWVVVPTALAWPKRWGRDIPFATLVETIRNLEHRLRIVAFALGAGLVILLLHLVFYPWPANIDDLQDLHKQHQLQGPRVKGPPAPTAP
jgi:hypothetical protein